MSQLGHLQLSDDELCSYFCKEIAKGQIISQLPRIRTTSLSEGKHNEVVIQAQSSRGDVTPVEVKDNKDGSYSASFVANQVGEVKLSVTIKGQQIKGSPFNVKVHGKYTTIDKSSKVVNEGGRMGQPYGIGFGRYGMWAVTDYSYHCVWIFYGDQLVRKFGSKGIDMVNSTAHVG